MTLKEHEDRTAEFVCRLQENPAAIGKYRTNRCDECGALIGEPVMTDCGPQPFEAVHHVVDGSVVVGCEGYWQVDPRNVGLDLGIWQDWTVRNAD